MTDPSTAVADWRTGVVRQCATLCDTCIYRPGNLAHLKPGRVQEMTRAATEAEGHVVCHATIGTAAPAICAGFAGHPVGAARSLALAWRAPARPCSTSSPHPARKDDQHE